MTTTLLDTQTTLTSCPSRHRRRHNGGRSRVPHIHSHARGRPFDSRSLGVRLLVPELGVSNISVSSYPNYGQGALAREI